MGSHFFRQLGTIGNFLPLMFVGVEPPNLKFSDMYIQGMYLTYLETNTTY